METIKFIHCADLHLDSPFVGLNTLPNKIYEQVKESTFRAFSKVVDLAIEFSVDFVIIAGDLYDGEDRSIRAQLFLKKELERLEKQGIHAFIVHGNHDHLGGKWTKVNMPSNTHIFPPKAKMIPFTTKTGGKIHLYGYSYPSKHVYEKIVERYEKVDGADYHIGILHGHDSLDNRHYRYAPFQVTDLLDKDFDYWALGHIHKTRILHENPYIVYPGNIQGRNPKEDGPKGCYVVEMNPYRTSVTFHETNVILWDAIELTDEETFEQFDQLYNRLIRLKERMRRKKKSVILDISLSKKQLSSSLIELVESEELLDLLREGEEKELPFVWVRSLSFSDENSMSIFLNENHEFFRELNESLHQLDNFERPLAPLFSHRVAKKYIQPFTKEEEMEIKGKVQQLFSRYFSTKG
ncbi:metallophosphoesterase family protein [Fervidibacillus halotolerans]|uniref:DNA repair exonuclease n=1 Tax=Fervidibacillus halotolerans TaxID=2980027 RepID=A0A9E8RXR1_9BACI|nr:DNA repair exonuclease [Fervidibacillus halotolerans]WAA13005.1 DNA repair exonuclease [Fervidibacillus halotolerans]